MLLLVPKHSHIALETCSGNV